MKIQPNLMNIVPLHDSIAKQYRHPGCCTGQPIVPNGEVPPMLLTTYDGLPDGALQTVRVDFSAFNYDMSEYNGNYRGRVQADGRIRLDYAELTSSTEEGQAAPTIQETDAGVVSDGDSSGTTKDWFIQINPNTSQQGKEYRITFGGTGSVLAGYELYVSKSELETGGMFIVDGEESNYIEMAIGAIEMEYVGQLNAGIYLHDACTGDVVESMPIVLLPVRKVEEPYYSDKRQGYIRILGMTFKSSHNDGVYYIRFQIPGGRYYSDTFMWKTDLNGLVNIQYRRNEPVITTKNYLQFTDEDDDVWLYMYVSANIIKPPFKFDATVTETDGRKFVEKLVSYRSDRFSFLCTSHFAEALRLLWHCDERFVLDDVDMREVEYMEPPKIDWSSDNLLCTAEVEFQSDTVVQTNGIAKAYY